MATMLRRAGLREAASEAMRDLPEPVDLDQVEAWGHGTASPETISSAVWAAAHDAVCRPPAQSAAARFTARGRRQEQMMEVQAEKTWHSLPRRYWTQGQNSLGVDTWPGRRWRHRFPEPARPKRSRTGRWSLPGQRARGYDLV